MQYIYFTLSGKYKKEKNESDVLLFVIGLHNDGEDMRLKDMEVHTRHILFYWACMGIHIKNTYSFVMNICNYVHKTFIYIHTFNIKTKPIQKNTSNEAKGEK